MKKPMLDCDSHTAQRNQAISKHSTLGNKTIVRSQDLLGPDGQLLIEHCGEHYCLRVTKLNKLILTK